MEKHRKNVTKVLISIIIALVVLIIVYVVLTLTGVINFNRIQEPNNILNTPKEDNNIDNNKDNNTSTNNSNTNNSSGKEDNNTNNKLPVTNKVNSNSVVKTYVHNNITISLDTKLETYTMAFKDSQSMGLYTGIYSINGKMLTLERKAESVASGYTVPDKLTLEYSDEYLKINDIKLNENRSDLKVYIFNSSSKTNFASLGEGTNIINYMSIVLDSNFKTFAINVKDGQSMDSASGFYTVSGDTYTLNLKKEIGYGGFTLSKSIKAKLVGNNLVIDGNNLSLE